MAHAGRQLGAGIGPTGRPDPRRVAMNAPAWIRRRRPSRRPPPQGTIAAGAPIQPSRPRRADAP
eukprot:10541141-Lingulodinium_polyedra.AAC.1